MEAWQIIHHPLILLGYAFLTAKCLVLNIWLWDISHDFSNRQRHRDERYGKAAFFYSLIWTAHYGSYFVSALCLPLPKLPKSLRLKMETRFSSLHEIAIRIGFALRFYQWLSYFRATEEAENASYCLECIFGLAWVSFWPIMNSSLDIFFNIAFDMYWPFTAQNIRRGRPNLELKGEAQFQELLSVENKKAEA
ncbi:hypothetical protein CI102_10573 [Trichoderma harzianum]|uniref:Uncharacterized protein n=1 Tax=Trichoderma harzianum CBS 226.95 TaxID=983964 RepID=A0A2T4A2H7_TRIHA|nr:hypothetical protein M431DRAFT_238958 [Trichoderma harzianum CBS 226.95]PKK44408.1 hypothetical protein CI102_10573 [Trichoderma harzianum]PTB51277.1 hypothetical protein M431DRAFT_238958 [Trichoderma harzianum CBS 226.95]